MLSVCEEHDKFSYQLVDVLFSWIYFKSKSSGMTENMYTTRYGWRSAVTAASLVKLLSGFAKLQEESRL